MNLMSNTLEWRLSLPTSIKEGVLIQTQQPKDQQRKHNQQLTPLKFSQMQLQLNQSRLNPLLKHKSPQLPRLNQLLLKRTRLKRSKKRVNNSLLKQGPQLRHLLKVLRPLQKSLLAQPQRLELFTEEERQELKSPRREPLLEAPQPPKPNLLTLPPPRHNQLKLNLQPRLLKPLPQKTHNQLHKSNQQLQKTSQKLQLRLSQPKVVLELTQPKKLNKSESPVDPTDP